MYIGYAYISKILSNILYIKYWTYQYAYWISNIQYQWCSQQGCQGCRPPPAGNSAPLARGLDDSNERPAQTPAPPDFWPAPPAQKPATTLIYIYIYILRRIIKAQCFLGLFLPYPLPLCVCVCVSLCVWSVSVCGMCAVCVCGLCLCVCVCLGI